jgi:hypothetical protein
MSREVLRNYNRRLNILNKINNMKLKIKKNDLFKKNMSQGELYKVYKTFKAKKEMDKFLNKLITKNGTTKY